MTTFFVGQRVRLVVASAENLGAEGRIYALGLWNPGDSLWPGANFARDASGAADCIVDFDRELVARGKRDGYRFPCELRRLEPILPEGMQPVEWSECLWQPEGVEA